MAGWVAVWSRNEAKPDQGRWALSLNEAVRHGGAIDQYSDGRMALAGWRRDGGEYPLSGKILAANGARVAWIGQCVEDSGDASEQAVARLADERFDDARVAACNGPFAAVVFKAEPFEVRVVTDRHRHYQVYLHRGRDVVVASTDIRCVVPWLERPALSPDAVDMLLRCGELIDRQTLLEGVDMMPPASVLIDSNGNSTERRYWVMCSDGVGGLAQTADRLADALQTAVRRQEAVTNRLGITLSGGLDSRIILDLCRHPEQVPSFTWGLPGCRDIVSASKFAALVKSPHVVRNWEPAAFLPLWSRGVDLTGGNCGIESMFMLPFVPLLASACNVVLNGLAGDAILGGNWLKQAWLQERNAKQLGKAIWRWRVAEKDDRLVDRLSRRSPGASSAGERWAASIAAREGARPVERMNDWLIENRVFRTTNCGTMLLRGGVESHAPFFDRDFIDELAKTNQDLKFKHRLYLEVMNKIAPRSASVEWQRTNVKPARGYYANLAAMAFHKATTKLASPLGITPFRDQQVADVPGWIRGPWREAIQGIIIDGRLSQRGLVNADVVQEIWAEHLTGIDHARQICVLVSIELFARRFLDGESL